MTLSAIEQNYINLFKVSCSASDMTGVIIYHALLRHNLALRNKLDFEIIPDVLLTLSTQTTEASQTLAKWLIAPERFNQDHSYALQYSIPEGLLLQSINHPESLERLLTWDVTKSLFTRSHMGLMKRFAQAILNSEEATVILLLRHFPSFTALRINQNTAPLNLALSLDVVSQPILKALIAAGANPNGDVPPSAPTIKLKGAEQLSTHRPLHQTIIQENLPAFNILFHAPGIDLQQCDGYDMPRVEATPMQKLSVHYFSQAANRKTAPEFTPLTLASLHNAFEMMQLITEKTSAHLPEEAGTSLTAPTAPQGTGRRKRFFDEDNTQRATEEEPTTDSHKKTTLSTLSQMR